MTIGHNKKIDILNMVKFCFLFKINFRCYANYVYVTVCEIWFTISIYLLVETENNYSCKIYSKIYFMYKYFFIALVKIK